MKYCIANWKMNMDNRLALIYLDDIGSFIYNDKENFDNVSMILCPPYTTIDLMSSILIESSEGILTDDNLGHVASLQLGAQNVNPNSNGAYTGEISIDMLNQYRIEWVIIGHSERRALFNESNEFINLKVKAALDNGIKPILCIGETLKDRKTGKTKDVLYDQLKNCLKNIRCSNDFLIAYEPVWAIGTGETADDDIIESTNDIILNILEDLKYDIENPKILYGGSVNNNNAKNLSKICNLDGFLIGGASLDAEQFYSIYKTLKLKGE